MAETKPSAIHSPTNNKQLSDLPAHPKFFSNFLLKVTLFAIFVALLPLLPPTLPNSTNPTFLSRTWELLHLLVVGIAISYGLFSQRNAESEQDKDRDTAFNADTPQSYVSRILQISSVFDDNESRAEIWSSLYHGPEPIVVESKPPLSPVQNFTESRVQSADSVDLSSVALPSPIPWRSRPERMGVGDQSFVMAPSEIPAICLKSESSEIPAIYSIRKRSFHVGTPPPPPPPPPPLPFSHPASISFGSKELKKTFKDELKDLSIKGVDGFLQNSSLLKPEFSSSQQNYQSETKKKDLEFMEDDSESEGGSNSYDDEEAADYSTEDRAEANGNEVDKKADEFIAKFREQIRLQRIESIKKSSRHRAVKNTQVKKR